MENRNVIEKVYYISPRDVRKNRSDAVFIMMQCYALASNGLQVSLITPTIKRNSYQTKFSEIFSLYGLKSLFSIEELPTRIEENEQGHSKPLHTVAQKFIHSSIFYWKNRRIFRQKNTVVYGHCFISTLPYILMRKMGITSSKLLFLGSSVKKKSFLHKIIFRNADVIISGCKYITRDIMEFGIKEDKFVDKRLFFLSTCMENKYEFDKKDCRKELNFQEDKKYVLYAGKTGVGMKKLDYLVECAERLREFNFVIVGANDLALKHYTNIVEKKKLTNLQIVSFLSLPEYSKYVKAADLLLDYYETNYYNLYYLGPGKASSYFSSKNPVLFSDMPSLRHLFPEEILFYVKPDNIEFLISKIVEIFKDPVEMNRRAENAYEYSQKYTYQYAMKQVIDFCESKFYGVNKV